MSQSTLFDKEEYDMQNSMIEAEPKPATRQEPIQNARQAGRNDLLDAFWEEDFDTVSKSNKVRENSRVKDLFQESVYNTRVIGSREFDVSVSRKIQVGLYPSDAELLEELFIQSKKAGLSNVSRARILRVALRHFHTCWLNQD